MENSASSMSEHEAEGGSGNTMHAKRRWLADDLVHVLASFDFTPELEGPPLFPWQLRGPPPWPVESGLHREDDVGRAAPQRGGLCFPTAPNGEALQCRLKEGGPTESDPELAVTGDASTSCTSAPEQDALNRCSDRGGVTSGTSTRESESDACRGRPCTGSLPEPGSATWVVSLSLNSVFGADAVLVGSRSEGNRGIGVRYGMREAEETDAQAYTGEPSTTGEVSNTLAASWRSPSVTGGGEQPRRW